MQEDKNIGYIPVMEIGVTTIPLPSLDLDFWVKKCYELKPSFPSREKSNRGGWQSQEMEEESKFFKLINFINPILANFHKSPNIIISEMWVNISSHGHFNSIHHHNHPNQHIDKTSGVLYLKVPPNSGNIIFYDPGNLSRQTEIPPTEGYLFLFPSSLYHSVSPNQSTEDRISIAFNCNK